MIYDYGKGTEKNFIVAADEFGQDKGFLQKYEPVMCIGNGYMCMRAATEEEYPGQLRSTLVAGTFDRYREEPTELPFIADVSPVDIYVDGKKLDLRKGVLSNYFVSINLKNGLLTRSFDWTAPNGKQIRFESERMISLAQLHIYSAKLRVTAVSDAHIAVASGLNTKTVAAPHCEKKSLLAKDYIQVVQTTRQSGIDIVATVVNVCDAEKTTKKGRTHAEDIFEKDLRAGQSLTLQKFASVYTMRDKTSEGLTLRKLKTVGRKAAQKAAEKGFDALLKASASAWKKRVWSNMDAVIDCKHGFDQLAYRFAVYHLTVMTPAHDDRMNIGAKGLSGPGYSGHAFWDTEIYMLPAFVFARPDVARSLLISRWHGLAGAHKKAKDNGYEGAMFPWEAAWIDNNEETPGWALSGKLEHHITADIAYAVHLYYSVTGDEDFMKKYGYELLFDTAKYWVSRFDYNKELDRYDINNVIGPDEYHEGVNNNAYTNYLANLNLELAVEYYEKLKKSSPELFAALSEKLGLDKVYAEWTTKGKKLYLPKINKDGLLPQDDKFLSLEDVDLTGFKNGTEPFPNVAVCNTQITKQADVTALFLLLEDLFTPEEKVHNLEYYEKRCAHTSSLSLSTYATLAADINLSDYSYSLFEKACRIDLGDKEMGSSVAGLHAASLGGIWQCVVFGYLGVRLYGQKLRIQPNLPKTWKKVRTKIYWHGCHLEICADKKTVTVKKLGGDGDVSFLCGGKDYSVKDVLTVEYR
mgnify:FL=1